MTSVIARARQQNELTGKQTTAIDITEGDPFYENAAALSRYREVDFTV